MNILVICQYYTPEPFRVHDLCTELVNRGHTVQVVTGMPNYPLGELYHGYQQNKPSDELKDGVRIHRCPIHPRKQGALHRVWNYYSFPAAASRYLRSKAFRDRNAGKFDIVFVYQLSPVMMALPGIRYAKKHHIPVILYCLDLWPESLLAGGVGRKSAVYRFFHRNSGNIYRSVDKLLITSSQFSDYLKNEFSISADRIAYLPQYAEELFTPLPSKQSDGVTDLLFAGNLGSLQSLDTILDAAARLKNEHIRFRIAGDGSVYEHLRQRVDREELSNVQLLGRRPVEEMPALYQSADAMLVTLKKDPVLSLTLPGKVQSYLAAGKPIIGAIDGEAAKVIRDARCGFCAPAEDVSGLVQCIQAFVDAADKDEMARNAAAYSREHFSKEIFFDRLLSFISAELR